MFQCFICRSCKHNWNTNCRNNLWACWKLWHSLLCGWDIFHFGRLHKSCCTDFTQNWEVFMAATVQARPGEEAARMSLSDQLSDTWTFLKDAILSFKMLSMILCILSSILFQLFMYSWKKILLRKFPQMNYKTWTEWMSKVKKLLLPAIGDGGNFI